MADRTQAGTTTRRRHPPHMRVTRCRPGQTRDRDEFLRGRSTQINPGWPSATLPHMNPQHPAKPQVNSHTGGSPVPTVVDLGGTYYNTKPQVDALETLLRKLPDPAEP